MRVVGRMDRGGVFIFIFLQEVDHTDGVLRHLWGSAYLCLFTMEKGLHQRALWGTLFFWPLHVDPVSVS